jgi:dihydrofolate reductase
MQTISVIVAMAKNRAIGNKGKIPWHLPADLARFKKLTLGHAVVVGRKTYESIGRPLPGRRNIVVTREQDYIAPGCEVAESLDSAFRLAGDGEVFVIGGAEIYRQALPVAKRIYLTLVDGEFPADSYFPEIDGRDWRETENTPGVEDEKNSLKHSFVVLERI